MITRLAPALALAALAISTAAPACLDTVACVPIAVPIYNADCGGRQAKSTDAERSLALNLNIFSRR